MKAHELDDWGSSKNDYIWNSITWGCKCNKACRTDEYLNTNNCLCKKCLIDKIVLECQDEILNTTETSLDDKKVICKKKIKNKKLANPHNFVGSYMLVIVNCRFYQLLFLTNKI